MNEEFDNLDQLEPILRNLYLEDKIDDNKYQTELVSIAASYAIAGRRQEASELISRLSKEFVEDVLPKLINEDPLYKLKAMKVAEFLFDGLDKEIEEIEVDLLLAKMNKNGIVS